MILSFFFFLISLKHAHDSNYLNSTYKRQEILVDGLLYEA